MNLLAKRDGVCLQERVHVLPAVQLSNPANLCIDDHRRSIAGPIAKHKTLNMRSPDLTTMVDELARWVDHDLRSVQAVEIDFRVSQRDEDRVPLGSRTDTVHLG